MTVSSSQESAAPRPRKSGSDRVVVPHAPRWPHRLAAWLIVGLIRVVATTLRYRWRDDSGYLEQPADPAIYAVWHNRLVLSVPSYYRYVRQRTRSAGLAAMVSASKDGGFLVAILERFKVQPVRGSSSRRGPQALLELTTWAERGYDLAITPDGPRGPCYKVQDGATSLAQITGLPIIPFSYNARWKLRINSWDRFLIPLPFSYCEVRFGRPIRVPREATEEERANLRLQLESALREISQD